MRASFFTTSVATGLVLLSASADTGPALAQAAERPTLTKSTIDGLVVIKSVLASRPGRIGCSTNATLSGSPANLPHKVTVTYTKVPGDSSLIEFQVSHVWTAARIEPVLTIGSASVSGIADMRGKANQYVSFYKPESAFNRILGEQGSATLSFDGKSYSWSTPTLSAMVNALRQCANG